MVENPKILIVEDEKPMAHALEIKMKAGGFDAQTAHDGEQAMKALEANEFDLIILDLIMPRLDGFGVLERMKDKHIGTPVIVASNLGQDTDIKRALALGAIDYFVKSNVSIADIIAKVKSKLNMA